MSSESVATSSQTSSSRLRQFGLYRSIDSKTEEFLKLSRKKQIRQGCVCAAVSTAVTVTVVIIVILIYEYSSDSNIDEKNSIWLSYSNANGTDTSAFEEQFTNVFNFDRNTIKLLPLIFKALRQNRYFEKAIEDTSLNPIDDKKVATETYRKNIMSDSRNWFKWPASKLYTIEYKTSPILLINPTRSLEYYKKIQKIKDYQRVLNYVDKMINEKNGFESTKSVIKKEYVKSERQPVKKSTIPIKIRKITKLENLKNHTNTKNIKREPKNVIENCKCPKKLGELLNKLISSIQKLTPDVIKANKESPGLCNSTNTKINSIKSISESTTHVTTTSVVTTPASVTTTTINTTSIKITESTTPDPFHILSIFLNNTQKAPNEANKTILRKQDVEDMYETAPNNDFNFKFLNKMSSQEKDDHTNDTDILDSNFVNNIKITTSKEHVIEATEIDDNLKHKTTKPMASKSIINRFLKYVIDNLKNNEKERNNNTEKYHILEKTTKPSLKTELTTENSVNQFYFMKYPVLQEKTTESFIRRQPKFPNHSDYITNTIKNITNFNALNIKSRKGNGSFEQHIKKIEPKFSVKATNKTLRVIETSTFPSNNDIRKRYPFDFDTLEKIGNVFYAPIPDNNENISKYIKKQTEDSEFSYLDKNVDSILISKGTKEQTVKTKYTGPDETVADVESFRYTLDDEFDEEVYKPTDNYSKEKNLMKTLKSKPTTDPLQLMRNQKLFKSNNIASYLDMNRNNWKHGDGIQDYDYKYDFTLK